MRSAASLALFLALGFVAAGCGKDEPKPAVPEMGAPSGLAELSAADRAIAEKQKVCPVSGKLLGSMGKPVRMEKDGVVVFLCCGHCKEAFK